jgi:hypothetical protein
LILADTGLNSFEWNTYVLNVVEEFECKDLIHPRFLKAWLERPFYEVEGVGSVGGSATFLDKSGKVSRCRFFAVSRREQFENFLKRQMARRGGDAKFIGSKNSGIIRVPPTPIPEGETHSVSWADFHIRYSEGLILWGDSASIKAVNAKALSRIVRSAKNKHIYVNVRPAAVPKSFRDEFLKTSLTMARAKLQKFDIETDTEYSSRRTGGEAYLRALQSALFEVEELTAWIERKPEKSIGRVHLKFLAATRSAETVSSLRGSDQILSGGPAGDIVSARICVRLSPMVQRLVKAGIENVISSEGLRTLLAQLFGSESVVASIDVSSGGKTLPVHAGLQARDIGLASQNYFRSLLGQIASYQNGLFELSATFSDGIVQVSSEDTLDRVESSKVVREGKLQPLLLAKGDLSSINESGEGLKHVFSDLEKLCQLWTLHRAPERISRSRLWDEASREFRSLEDKIKPDGNWEFEFAVRAGKRDLSVVWSLGSDLAALTTAHTRIAETKLYNLVRQRRRRGR